MITFLPDVQHWLDPSACAGIRMDPQPDGRVHLVIFVWHQSGIAPFSTTAFESMDAASKAAKNIAHSIKLVQVVGQGVDPEIPQCSTCTQSLH